MEPLLVILGLGIAWILLRMWDAAGRPLEEDPAAGHAGDAPPFEPPSHAGRVVLIVAAIVVGAVLEVGVPLALDAMAGDDGGPGYQDPIVTYVCADPPPTTGAEAGRIRAATLRDLCE